ncbi:cation channel sperm-associated protein 2-like isoform X1 [Clytia hemisphaerica]|uniref:Ion transport domain-containing protein n=2 Tax=Clytia hemisphaerica TaxID=252671 RepID=A0A7M5XEB9_9CNID
MKSDYLEDLTPRAEIFRSKLIEDFQLLASFNNSSSESPKYYSSDLCESQELMDKMLKENPHGLVKFQVYSTKGESTYEDRRLNRVKTKNAIPFGPWAKMIVENQFFQNLMLAIILANSIVLGIQAELTQTEASSYKGLKLVLDIFDYISMLVFILEILLKWVDAFWDFWKNGWNNFDFLVTVMSLVPEMIKLLSGEQTAQLAVVAENLRVFRILRSLKMVSRFAQLRIIVLTILKAFKSMVFISTLLAVFMYIFAVAGTIMFSRQPGDPYPHIEGKFNTLGQSLATLFQLFTLDHWFDVLNELTIVSNDIVSKCYIILWICFGAFVFRNIFAGIMVMNFQNIRADFTTQCNEREMEIQEVSNERLLENELAVQYRRASSIVSGDGRRRSTVLDSIQRTTTIYSNQHLSVIAEDAQSKEEEEVEDNGDNKENDYLPNNENMRTEEEDATKPAWPLHRHSYNKGSEFPESTSWNNAVRLNLKNLSSMNKETLWPRDYLFKYLQLMEALQDNLVERHQLQRLAALAISNLQDSSITKDKKAVY